MSAPSVRKHYRGSTGPIDGFVKSTKPSFVLGSQTIEARIAGGSWITGAWLGSPGSQREFEFPVTDADLPPRNGQFPVQVRITGPGYSVIFMAGQLHVL